MYFSWLRTNLPYFAGRVRVENNPGRVDVVFTDPDPGWAAYPMLPAIATPRFEFGRQSWEALETLDHYRTFPIEHMIPGHLRVISGREEVAGFAEREIRVKNRKHSWRKVASIAQMWLP